MASSQYGSLTPIQQYNQLSFAVIPPSNPPPKQLHPSSHPHPRPHSQSQSHLHHQLHHTASTTTIPAPVYQQQPQQQHPSALSPAVQPTLQTNNSNVIQQQQQQNIEANTDPSLNTEPLTSTPSTNNTPTIATPDNNVAVDTSATTPTTEPQRKRRRIGRPPKSQAARDYLATTATLPQPSQPTRAPIVHTPHPLNRGPYNTSDDAVFSLQLHVFTSGYGVSQKRTVKEKLPSGRYDPSGNVIRKDFSCDRGGAEFVSQSTGERRRESKKCGCQWKAVVRRLKREGDLWFVEVLDANHNHPVTPPDQMHTIASYRRWQRENNAGIRSAIDRLARAAAMPALQVADYLKGRFADPDLDRIDRHILRALSMSDVETNPGAATTEATVFDVVARRPTIILQENVGDGGGGTGASGSSGAAVGY
ncbi:uncharacterized protein F4822DRAFT_397733 [Hypoxylon trugodes]|uniref:uncharacterized protein n=1 Tax=Hypoxylon trugodes TaxID=326681 RepID=UPI002198D70B|nr:uncharacterized protein F4822DRAFT_397733 [Hypoxylon trugodes]KAI1389284.1 hypothetical protein F4822DRAFT_397733 [Hypoxylon trugodes]